jgi:N-glycosylase/DNA lyase
MMTERLDFAIGAICQEVGAQQAIRRDWKELSEDTLFRELAACILGSRVPYEMALAATNQLAEQGLLRFHDDDGGYLLRVEEALCQPLSNSEWKRCRRYRFPKTRSKALASTAAAFYADGGNVKEWLGRFSDSMSARRGLVEKASGLGPKQASMVLRNIGFCDQLAILDSHLMRFMKLRGLADSRPGCMSTVDGYEAIERRFLDYAARSGWPPAVLDQAIWIVMRVCSRRPA